MSNENKFWNLAQATAWAMYRSMKLVDQTNTKFALVALSLYPEMAEEEHGPRVGSSEDLLNALRSGTVKALGRGGDGRRVDVPANEWIDLTPDGLDAVSDDGKTRWRDIRIAVSNVVAVLPMEPPKRKRGGGRPPAGNYRGPLRSLILQLEQDGKIGQLPSGRFVDLVRKKLNERGVRGVPKSRSGLTDAIDAIRKELGVSNLPKTRRE